MGGLTKAINTTNYTSEFMIKSWNQSLEILKIRIKTGIKEITPQLAEKYKFDLYGLFYNEFNIPKIMIYPNIRLNGYDSSYCYDGKRLRFRLFESSGLADYATAFAKAEKKLS